MSGFHKSGHICTCICICREHLAGLVIANCEIENIILMVGEKKFGKWIDSTIRKVIINLANQINNICMYVCTYFFSTPSIKRCRKNVL